MACTNWKKPVNISPCEGISHPNRLNFSSSGNDRSSQAPLKLFSKILYWIQYQNQVVKVQSYDYELFIDFFFILKSLKLFWTINCKNLLVIKQIISNHNWRYYIQSSCFIRRILSTTFYLAVRASANITSFGREMYRDVLVVKHKHRRTFI